MSNTETWGKTSRVFSIPGKTAKISKFAVYENHVLKR